MSSFDSDESQGANLLLIWIFLIGAIWSRTAAILESRNETASSTFSHRYNGSQLIFFTAVTNSVLLKFLKHRFTMYLCCLMILLTYLVAGGINGEFFYTTYTTIKATKKVTKKSDHKKVATQMGIWALWFKWPTRPKKATRKSDRHIMTRQNCIKMTRNGNPNFMTDGF